MALPRRRLFRRGLTYVAVKRIRLSADDYIEAGKQLDNIFPTWRLKSWYRRGFIGIKDDPWTVWTLERTGARYEKDLEREEKEAAELEEQGKKAPKTKTKTRVSRVKGALSRLKKKEGKTEKGGD